MPLNAVKAPGPSPMRDLSPIGKKVTRPCYVCKRRDNPVIASERCEERFGRPLMPEGVYDFVRCRDCGTLYVDSDVNEAYLAAIYEHETIDVGQGGKSEAAAEASVRDVRMPEFRAHWALLRRLRAPRAGDRLLDMGCQMGDFAALAQAEGVIPYGIEISEDYAARCQRTWNARPEQIHRGPLSAATYPDRSFAYITAFETLEHILNPIEALRAFRGWLQDDGLIAFSVPSSDYFHFKYWALRSSPAAGILRRRMARRHAGYAQQVLPHTHVYNFTPRSARLMLRQAGLTPIHVSLTGWHGQFASLFRPMTTGLNAVTLNRVSLAPSIVAVGRKRLLA
jgi:2-polyprenyl-3-methyl-5-hydroxy-6-metoxy-1,4-benzoquinol methylase